MGALGLILLRGLRAAPLLATLAATLWALSTNPFTAPYVDRAGADLALTLERQVARTATPDWLAASLKQAVTAEDVDRAAMLLDLADDLGHDVDRHAAEAMIADASGMMAQAGACGACMIDIATCPSIRHIAACAAPFELSPLGDLNALRRAGVAWSVGDDIDTLDASLGLVGLGATGAIIVTGGSSATVKAGTGLIRMARRMGSVTPDLARLLRLPVQWGRVPGYLRGSTKLADVTDTRQLARVVLVARQMDAVRLSTSTPEALRLLRHVDGPEDAARLARVADAAGPRTSRSFAVLGKSRVFRATVRLSRAAATTLILLALTAVQIAAVVGTRLGALTLRAVTPSPSPRVDPVLTRSRKE